MSWYRSHILHRLAACAAISAAAGGCAGSSDPDHAVVAAVVFGTVTLPSGAPAKGARLSGLSYQQGCSGLVAAGGEVAVTDSLGSYRVLLRDITFGPRPMCVQVIVFPGSAGVTDTVKVTGPTLAFRSTLSGEPLDSARVDVRLP